MPLVDMSAYNNRPRYFQDALQGYIDGRQQDRTNEDAQTRTRASVYLQQLMKLPDDQKAAALQQLPADIKPYFMDTNALPAHQLTDGEQLQAKADADANKRYGTLPVSVLQESAYRRANGADTPAEMTKVLSQNDILSNPQGFAPQMQDAVAIEQKRMLDANQTREGNQFQQEYNGIKLPESKAKISHENEEYNGIKLPESKAKISHENAMTAFESGPHSDAERARAYQERASGGLAIAKTGEITSPGAAGFDPVAAAKAVLADPTGQTLHQYKGDQYNQVAGLVGQMNGSVPQVDKSGESDRIIAASIARSMVDDMKAITDKWAKRGDPLNSRVGGTVQNFANAHLGGALDINPERAADIAKYNDYKQLLGGVEARAAMGRANQQYTNQIMTILPDLGASDAKLSGAYDAAARRADSVRAQVLGKLWGGKPPASAQDYRTIAAQFGGTMGYTPDGPRIGASGGKPIDEGTAASFLKMAGGDKQKARTLAAQAGYAF